MKHPVTPLTWTKGKGKFWPQELKNAGFCPTVGWISIAFIPTVEGQTQDTGFYQIAI